MALHTLQDFYQELQDKGVRLTHQYQLSFEGIPTGGDLSKITMWAEGATLPGRTQETAEVPFLAYPFSIPTKLGMTNSISLTIRSDADMNIRDILLDWQNYHSNASIATGGSGEGDKKAPDEGVKVILDLYDDTLSTIVQSYSLIGVIPGNVGDATLSQADASVVTFDLTLKYQYWERNNEAGGASASGTSGGRLGKVIGALNKASSTLNAGARVARALGGLASIFKK